MDSDKLNDWMQVVGIFAVVASLIFVGLEMRQSHEISLSQAYQFRASAVVEWNLAFAANAAALSAKRKAANAAVADITTEEFDAYGSMPDGSFHLFDNAHYQYQQGFVSEEFWLMTRQNLRNMMSNPVSKSIFLDKVDRGVRPDFGDVVLSVSKELE